MKHRPSGDLKSSNNNNNNNNNNICDIGKESKYNMAVYTTIFILKRMDQF
jgi:hypothetical protein